MGGVACYPVSVSAVTQALLESWRCVCVCFGGGRGGVGLISGR